MVGRRGPFVIGIMVAVVLGLGAVGLLFATGDVPSRRGSTGATGGIAAEGGPAVAPPDVAIAAPPGSLAPGGDPSRTATPGARPVGLPAAARPPPDEGPDAASWRDAKVAFRLRELGRLAPYVKAGLDAARRDMAFCFREAGGASAGAAARGADPGNGPPDPAILLLYLEAREGALDVIDTRTDHLGGATPELVECCREVLRGLEIPAFGAVPGRRYRLKYRLE